MIGIQIRLEQNGGGKIIQVTGALAPRGVHGNPGGARILRGKGFIPHLHREGRLGLQRFGKTSRLPPGKVRVAFFIEGLPHHDQAGGVNGSLLRHRGCIQQAADMRDHSQWAGDGTGRVAEGQADILRAVVNCKDSQGSFPIMAGSPRSAAPSEAATAKRTA
jgi:hypothetical protein